MWCVKDFKLCNIVSVSGPVKEPAPVSTLRGSLSTAEHFNVTHLIRFVTHLLSVLYSFFIFFYLIKMKSNTGTRTERSDWRRRNIKQDRIEEVNVKQNQNKKYTESHFQCISAVMWLNRIEEWIFVLIWGTNPNLQPWVIFSTLWGYNTEINIDTQIKLQNETLLSI